MTSRLLINRNIARIANAVQVTLGLSVINPQCHDLSFSIFLEYSTVPMSHLITKSLSMSLRGAKYKTFCSRLDTTEVFKFLRIDYCGLPQILQMALQLPFMFQK